MNDLPVIDVAAVRAGEVAVLSLVSCMGVRCVRRLGTAERAR
jgi:hypothetical protein